MRIPHFCQEFDEKSSHLCENRSTAYSVIQGQQECSGSLFFSESCSLIRNPPCRPGFSVARRVLLWSSQAIQGSSFLQSKAACYCPPVRRIPTALRWVTCNRSPCAYLSACKIPSHPPNSPTPQGADRCWLFQKTDQSCHPFAYHQLECGRDLASTPCPSFRHLGASSQP